MSDFEKYVIEQFTLLQNDIKTLKQDINEIKTDILGTKQDINEIKTNILGIKQDISNIKSDIVEIKKCLPYPTDNLDILNKVEGVKNSVNIPLIPDNIKAVK